ncbi:MAG TPA: ribosome biogenesis GTPase Der [Nevskiaceae bacterium]
MESRRLPVVALVGRPNVGKSTLFNRMTDTQDALVADIPGLTRDRQYGNGRFAGRRFIVIDTGGLAPEGGSALERLAERQAQLAIDDADRLILLVDGRNGLLPADAALAAELRRSGKPLQLWVNKMEGLPAAALADFHALGLGLPMAISALRGDGIAEALKQLVGQFAPPAAESMSDDPQRIRMAVVGRPNVGKSTLANRLVGAERVLASDEPGTTRDAVRVDFEWDGVPFELVDTAGIRRRARVADGLEKLSVVKALQAIERAQVVVVMVDAQDDVGAQDARLMGLVAQRGRAMVVALNKWDGLGESGRQAARDAVDYRLPFLDYVALQPISALHGSGLRELMDAVTAAWRATTRPLPTPELNRVLLRAVEEHPPRAVLGRRIKLRYAHQASRDPLTIMIHGNQTAQLRDSYKTYLARAFRKAFDLNGVPLRLEFRTGDNPYRKRRVEPPGRHVRRRRTPPR